MSRNKNRKMKTKMRLRPNPTKKKSKIVSSPNSLKKRNNPKKMRQMIKRMKRYKLPKNTIRV